MSAAAASTRWGALRRAAALVRPHRRRVVVSILLGAGAVLAAVGLLAVAGVLISKAALRPEILTLTVFTVSVRALAITRALLRYLERLVSHDLAFRVLADLRVRFFTRLAPLVPEGLAGMRGGDVLSRFVADVDALQDLYLRAIGPPLIAAAVIGVVGIALLAVLPAAAPILVAALLAAGLLVPAIASRATAASGRRQAPARAELSAELVEIVQGAAELAVYGREDDWALRARQADARLLGAQRRDAVVGGLTAGLGVLIAGAALVGVTAVGVDATAQGALEGFLLAGAVFVAIGAFEAVNPLPDAAQRLNVCAGAAQRLEEITERPAPVSDPPAPQPVPSRGALVADGLTVRFPGREAPALSDVGLRLKSGARIAVVGTSGAGKTTLARALVRFLDPDAGAVTIGGLDVREAAQAQVRHTVRLAGQDAHLFTTTIRHNVALARPGASDEDIAGALRRVGLGDWLASLPDGLDTQVGEDGGEVSGGQRRRIALARALVSDARFLVLDEPTAHLDDRGAASLLRSLGGDRTDPRGMLVVSHTLAGLERWDEIVVLDGGRVAERGSPAALAAAGGAYAALRAGAARSG